MKKIYLSIFTICSVVIGLNAQTDLTDDFEGYTLGDVSAQATHWRTWAAPGTPTDDANVVDIFAASGFQSLNIDGTGVQDMILKIPALPTTGVYTIQWNMYVPAGKEGYFNMQGQDTADGTPWNQYLQGGNVYFNQDGLAAGVGAVDGTPGQAFAYPEDAWFLVSAIYDLDAQTWDMEIDGVNQFSGQEFTFNDPFVELAGINFFSVSTGNEYYVDDVVEKVGPPLSVDDLSSKGFSAYPNPVTSVLNLKANEVITSVEIFNVLGQKVYSANVDALRSTVDMSEFSSGAYLVNVDVNGTKGTLKIVK